MLFQTHITPENDKDRLMQAMNGATNTWWTRTPHLELLRRRVQHSRAVPAEQVPDDMITMNSRFVLRYDHSGTRASYALVYPQFEAPYAGKISVLSPMGSALYGARVGEEICWLSEAGPEVALIERLTFQPEAAYRAAATSPSQN